MPRWRARFELGDEYMTVEVEAPSKDEAQALVELQNARMAAANGRPLYLLKRLKVMEPEGRSWWRIGGRNGT